MFNGINKKHKLIGICCARIQDEYVKGITMSIGEEALRRGYRVLIFNSFSDLYQNDSYINGEASVYKLMNPEMLDALVVLPESIKRDSVSYGLIENAKAANVPVISVDRNTDRCCSIIFDYKSVFEQIVRHVVEHHKCTKVNFIAGMKGNSFSEERIDCYKKVLIENGIEFDKSRIGYGDFWELPTKMVMEKFLADERGLPEAIICCNDTMAITVCQILQQRGYNVPDDVIVTGFDGISLEKYVTPRLTTASVDIECMAVKALDTIEAIQQNKDVPNQIVIPFKMRTSQSCGCEKINTQSPMEKIIELYNRINDSSGHETHMFAYLSRTVDCKTSEELAKIIPRYSDYYTWICLNSDFFSDKRDENRFNDVFTEKMNLFVKCRYREYITNIPFDIHELLPDLEEALNDHNYLMFTPIHFQEEIHGYAVVGINDKDFIFSNNHRFINNTNQVLESFKNKSRLQAAYAEMAEMHQRDPMTGIYNRRGFYTKAADLMKKCCEEGYQAVLFSVDLDDLKHINDSYGHNMGDKAIKAVSDILEGFCGENEICSRFGGDEFIVLAAASNADEYARDFEIRIAKAIENFNQSNDNPFTLRISLGSASMNKCTSINLEEIIKAADIHMYEQKRQHKNVKAVNNYQIAAEN